MDSNWMGFDDGNTLNVKWARARALRVEMRPHNIDDDNDDDDSNDNNTY